MKEGYRRIGVVTHYYGKISVAVIELEDELYLDDWIVIFGPRTDLEQQVRSMEIDHAKVDKGEVGEEIAIKVDDVVREGDEIFLIVDEA